MENLQILENAGLAICSVNRQAIESGKMDVINDFIARGGSVFRFYSSSTPSVSGVTVSIAGGKQNHPLLKNVSGFVAKGLLQEDNPAGSDAEILLYGNTGNDVA
jgi:hypothetical protein